MQTLIEALIGITPTPFDCVVHVGAGRYAERSDYDALRPEHIVLVEGDPDAAANLRDRFQGEERMTVVSSLVGDGESEVTFHRFSLPSFNGPLGMGRLREIYPRITEIESIQLRSRSLSAIGRKQELHLGERNLLILDVPGQEASMLSVLRREELANFSYIILSGCSEAWMEGSVALDKSLATLEDAYFQTVREDNDDPAWPRHLLILDKIKLRMKWELDKNEFMSVERLHQIHQQEEKIKELERVVEEKQNFLMKMYRTKQTITECRESKLVDQIELLLREREALSTRLLELQNSNQLQLLNNCKINNKENKSTRLKEVIYPIRYSKYDLSHLEQFEDQYVIGPIQDDEALLLYAIIRGMRIQYVLELGGLEGYSAKNFLKAMGPEGILFTCDVHKVPSQGVNHRILTKDCRKLSAEDFDRKPLEMIFFDCHEYEAQMTCFDLLKMQGIVNDYTILALHDTNLHPAKHVDWAYPVEGGYVHQDVERRLVNTFSEKGYHAFMLHTNNNKHDCAFPFRHGITLMQKWKHLTV
jgi:hypothetical protein